MVSAMDLANYIIYNEYRHYNDGDNDGDKNRLIDNPRLQAYLYFIQAQSFCEFKEPCFKDKMEAWKFGPVVPSVYHQFPAFGPLRLKTEIIIPKRTKSLVDDVCDFLVEYSTEQLIEISKKQMPWRISQVEGKHNEITLKAMYDEFAREDNKT